MTTRTFDEVAADPKAPLGELVAAAKRENMTVICDESGGPIGYAPKPDPAEPSN